MVTSATGELCVQGLEPIQLLNHLELIVLRLRIRVLKALSLDAEWSYVGSVYDKRCWWKLLCGNVMKSTTIWGEVG